MSDESIDVLGLDDGEDARIGPRIRDIRQHLVGGFTQAGPSS
jgi:hypothetical protein